MIRTLSNIALWMMVSRAFAGEPIVNAPNLPPKLISDIGVNQHMDAQVPPDLTFVNETGQKVVLGQFFGKRPVAVSMVYYRCPNICTMSMTGVFKVLQAMALKVGQDFDVLFVSIDPTEKPLLARTKKAGYLKSYPVPGNPEGIHFLTGEPASIVKLADVLGFRYKYDTQTGQFAHPASLSILTPQGRVSRYIYGIEFPERDFRLALVEASQNKIGSPIDQFLLFCFHYDPNLGAYGPMVVNLIKLSGALTLVGLLILITSLLRAERRKKRLMVTN